MKKIAVVDFGGQYTHLIANRIRNLGLYSEIYQPENFDPTTGQDILGIILSGGPHSVMDAGSPTLKFDPRSSPYPILGLCYGHQLLAKLLGGTVEQGKTREYGPAVIACQPSSRLFHSIPKTRKVWMSHGDHVSRLPDGMVSTSSSKDLPIASFESTDGRFFGLQFHPEVTHTENGNEILDRFLSICSRERNWTPVAFRRELVERVRREAAANRLFLLLSGGVDSLVALALCIEAVGPDRVHSLHVDTGFMRENESAEIIEHLRNCGFENINLENAQDLFLGNLAGVTDPESKRKIIGNLFVDIVNRRMSGFEKDNNWLLVQGTIYPDRIESGATKNSSKIKTHHNRVEAIKRLMEQGRVLEPLKDLYKDEVRVLGKELGLPRGLINRHPFPGPGLAVRILASSNDRPEPGFDLETPQLGQILAKFGLDGCILPVRSVGVMGDSRTYLHPAAVWSKSKAFPGWDCLQEAALKIISGLRGVNRVVFSVQPLEGIKLIRCWCDKARADLLRKVDLAAREMTDRLEKIWQMPVVSLPAVDSLDRNLFVLRPVTSENAMTADFFRTDPDLLFNIVSGLSKIDGVGPVLYDVTSKPPGTIEWE